PLNINDNVPALNVPEAWLVNHLRRHVSQSINLFFYLPIVSRGILARQFFPYPQVFIWAINPVPDALHVDERDGAVFRTNADLSDNEAGAAIADCLPRFNVLCLLDNFHSALPIPLPAGYAEKENPKSICETDNPLNRAGLDIRRHSIDTLASVLDPSLSGSSL